MRWCAGKTPARRVKVEAVVIGIQEPGRNVLALAVVDFHGDWIKHVQPEQLHLEADVLKS